MPLNHLQTAILKLLGGPWLGQMGPVATTWVPMGTQVPVLSPNDHPNPSQGQQGGGYTHFWVPDPPPPSLQQHAPPPPNAPQGRKNGEGGEETGQGERDEPRRVTGQGRARSPKTVQSAEGGEGKGKRERIIVVVGSPCQEILQMHTPARTSQCWGRQTQYGLGVCIWMHLGQRHGQRPVSGTADPRSSPTGQVIRGLR